MSGILNNKTRIMDTVITAEGRRQIAAGTFKISFASFTDGSAFYEEDIVSGSTDASNRIYIETPSSLSKDQITFETNDAGKLVPFYGASDIFYTSDGKINVSGTMTAISSDSFASLASELIGTSIDNFQNTRILGTIDQFVDESGFEVSDNSLDFIITNNFPFDVKKDIIDIDIENVENFYHDKRLSHLPNFMYMPPINSSNKLPIGIFPCNGQKSIKSFNEIEKMLFNREKKVLSFPITSKDNNIVTQIFELSKGKMTKLDIIDFGDFNTNDEHHPTKQVFFIGKVFIDKTGNGTFVNQFVLIFD